MNALTKQKWISVVSGGVVVTGWLILVPLATGTAYFFARCFRTEPAPVQASAAAERFAAERLRFSASPPLIELPDDGEPRIHRRDAAAGGQIHELRGLAYNAGTHDLVHLIIPLWALRLSPVHRFTVGGRAFDADRLHLTVADLQHQGPGLIVEYRKSTGSALIIWAE